jgi:N-acetylneuraminic acid mutarotase
MSVAAVGGLIIAAYGESGGDTTLTRIYDVNSNTWRFGATAPTGPSAEGAAVAVDGNMYALGGRGEGDQNQMNNRYTPSSNTWRELALMPTGRTGLGAAHVGDFIYAIGGRTETDGPCTGGPLATAERYSIATNTWATVAPLPTARSDIGAVAYNGKIYVFGGCTGASEGDSFPVSSTVYIYDPGTNTWSTGASMPTARAGFYGVAVINGNIYVMGGLDSSGDTSSANEVYHIATNSWSTATPMIDPRGEMGVVSVGGQVFTVGGALPAFASEVDTNDAFRP